MNNYEIISERQEKVLRYLEGLGYKYVNFGKMMDFIKAGDDASTALEKTKGQYGRVADAARCIDPRRQ